jgi:hypothetical protein
MPARVYIRAMGAGYVTPDKGFAGTLVNGNFEVDAAKIPEGETYATVPDGLAGWETKGSVMVATSVPTMETLRSEGTMGKAFIGLTSDEASISQEVTGISHLNKESYCPHAVNRLYEATLGRPANSAEYSKALKNCEAGITNEEELVHLLRQKTEYKDTVPFNMLWHDGTFLTCADYESKGYCQDGKFLPNQGHMGQPGWTEAPESGKCGTHGDCAAFHNFPAKNCQVCGRLGPEFANPSQSVGGRRNLYTVAFQVAGSADAKLRVLATNAGEGDGSSTDDVYDMTEHNVLPAGDKWEDHSFSFSAISGSTTLKFENVGEGMVYIDEIQMYAGEPVTKLMYTAMSPSTCNPCWTIDSDWGACDCGEDAPNPTCCSKGKQFREVNCRVCLKETVFANMIVPDYFCTVNELPMPDREKPAVCREGCCKRRTTSEWSECEGCCCYINPGQSRTATCASFAVCQSAYHVLEGAQSACPMDKHLGTAIADDAMGAERACSAEHDCMSWSFSKRSGQVDLCAMHKPHTSGNPDGVVGWRNDESIAAKNPDGVGHIDLVDSGLPEEECPSVMPDLNQACGATNLCEYDWQPTAWPEKCVDGCGTSYRTRDIYCGYTNWCEGMVGTIDKETGEMIEGGYSVLDHCDADEWPTKKISIPTHLPGEWDERCVATRPDDHQSCTSFATCSYKWHVGVTVIHVIRAAWGSNCHGVHGNNAYLDLADKCEGMKDCTYEITADSAVGGDPSPSCAKDFVVDYSCGDMMKRNAYIGAEALGKTVGLSCGFEIGCADGTREGLLNGEKYGHVAACAGEVSGAISGDKGQELCSAGWNVCTGKDAVAKEIMFADAIAFGGCFQYDAASHYDPSKDVGICDKVCDFGTDLQRTYAAVGKDCRKVDPVGQGCLADEGIINSNGMASCQFGEDTTGVVCCKDDQADCNGDVGGNAYFDLHCLDPTTGKAPCVGGLTGKAPCKRDCMGEWGGTAYPDDCGLCITSESEKCIKGCLNENYEEYDAGATFNVDSMCINVKAALAE